MSYARAPSSQNGRLSGSVVVFAPVGRRGPVLVLFRFGGFLGWFWGVCGCFFRVVKV